MIIGMELQPLPDENAEIILYDEGRNDEIIFAQEFTHSDLHRLKRLITEYLDSVD